MNTKTRFILLLAIFSLIILLVFMPHDSVWFQVAFWIVVVLVIINFALTTNSVVIKNREFYDKYIKKENNDNSNS